MTFIILSLIRLSSLKVAKLLWNASFKANKLQLKKINYPKRMWELQLMNCRKEALYNLNALIGNCELPSNLKTTVTKDIFLLHQAYRQLFLWKETYDTCNKIDLLQNGELYAPNYFTIEGDFDDFSWSKHFVSNSDCNIEDRFSLSCSYFFETESENLWLELKQLYGAHIGLDLNFFDLFDDNLPVISCRLLQIQNQLNFWKTAFNLASDSGYEHGVYFIWEKMTDEERAFFYQSRKLFEIMSRGIDYPRDKISFFLFSQLTDAGKNRLLQWTVESQRYKIWHILLVSPCSREIRVEIISFYNLFPVNMYSDLLTALADRINTLQLPYDIEIFNVLWNNPTLERTTQILEGNAEFLQILASAKSLDNLRHVIKSLSHEQKINCLLHNQYRAGITIFGILCDDGAFDMFREYLTFFLTEIDLTTGIEVMSEDSSLILQDFIQTRDFILWHESQTFQNNRDQILSQIRILQTSLNLLQEVLGEVEERTRNS